MPTIIDREVWLRRASKSWTSSPSFNAAGVTNITNHWPGGNADLAKTDPLLYVAKVHDSHRSRAADGFPNIVYNWLVLPDGDIAEGRGFDFRCAANGDQASNVPSCAVQYAVGLDEAPTAEQIASGRWLTQQIWDKCPNIPHRVSLGKADRKGMTVHADWFATSCCGPILTQDTRDGVFLPKALDPDDEEPDMTPEEHQMLADALAGVKETNHLLWDADPSTNVNTYFAVQELHGQIVRGDAFIDRLVAALPSGGPGGLTVAEVVEACKTAAREGTA